AHEQPAVGAEVVAHLQGHLEVLVVLLLGDYDAAVARHVLAADDALLLGIDDPLAARLVLALAAVAGLGADLPALERLAVEDRHEALVLVVILVGRRRRAAQERQQAGRQRGRGEEAQHGAFSKRRGGRVMLYGPPRGAAPTRPRR